MTVPLLDENLAPISDQAGIQRVEDLPNAPPLTLGRAVMHALFAAFPDERDLPADQKWARAALAMQIKDSSEVELTAEQIVTIKRLVGKLYSGRVIMQAFPLLDPNATPPELK